MHDKDTRDHCVHQDMGTGSGVVRIGLCLAKNSMHQFIAYPGCNLVQGA